MQGCTLYFSQSTKMLSRSILRSAPRTLLRTAKPSSAFRQLPLKPRFPKISTPKFYSTTPPSPAVNSRLRTLFRTHGWSALTIYLLLSLADFSLTFLVVYAIGASKVRVAEDYVLEALGWRRKNGEPGKVKIVVDEWKSKKGKVRTEQELELEREKLAKRGTEADELEGYSAIATTAVLAYAIHKTLLLPVRIGLTVAITPKIVRTLRAWG